MAWHPRETEPRSNSPTDAQRWICNATLNVIFLPGTNGEQFQPIRREFSYSLVRWRQPLQSAYVTLALHPWVAYFFRCGTLEVTPPIADGHDWIIVPGNHKLRLLNRRASRCVSVAKVGFPREAFQREIEIGSLNAELGIPTAPLIESDLEAGWYCESFVNGTPLNRLQHSAIRQSMIEDALGHVRKLARQTTTLESIKNYSVQLIVQIRDMMSQGRLVERFGLASVPAIVDRLQQMTAWADWNVPISQTHGDFQPANILVDGDQLWIIDWELTGRRQAAYDLLVFQLAARFPIGLADRIRTADLCRSLSDWLDRPTDGSYQWQDAAKRSVYVALFLLEELQWRLQQLVPDCIFATGGGVELFLTEVDQWLKQKETL